jgi:hypothetical protein
MKNLLGVRKVLGKIGGKVKKWVVLPVVLVSFTGMAGRYFLGADIVPHTFGTATYGIPYVIVGYDTGISFANVGLSSPLTIDGWYQVKAGALYPLTPQLKLAGYFSVWGQLNNFVFTNGAWAVGCGVEYHFDHSMAVFLNFNLPYRVNPSVPFWGFWVDLGFKYYFGTESASTTK